MRLKLPYAATIAVILMVSQAAIAGEVFPKVLVTVAPLKPYVDEIMRGQGTSESLLRPGQDLHHFALAPTQAQALDAADVLIVPDLGMSPFLKQRVARQKKLRVIELSKLAGAAPLPYAAENPWLAALKQKNAPKANAHTHDADEDEEEHAHEHGHTSDAPLTDPHLWLDPERMAAIAEPLAAALAEAAPEARPALTANAQTLARHLREEVLPAMRTMLSPPARTSNALNLSETPFLTYHAAYQYFLGRFGLTHYGELTTRPEEVMGAATLRGLLQRADTQRVRCLIGEQESTLMQRVASATGAKIRLLNPEQLPKRSEVDALDWIQNDYDRLLYQTAKTFAGCL